MKKDVINNLGTTNKEEIVNEELSQTLANT